MLKIIKPDDFHAHFRQGDMLKTVLPFAKKQFTRAIVMPNTVPPITNVQQALAYKAEIQSLTNNFTPLMTLYFSNELTEEMILEAKQAGIVGVKLYPKGATTNSEAGVSSIQEQFPVLQLLEKYDLPLLIHGEVVDKEVDIFYREKVFVDTILKEIIETFPKLRVVMEHVTSAYAADFIANAPENVCATITPHHLFITRNDILVGGIKPHLYCLPIAKKEEDKIALRKHATSGSKKFFAGTDSAPHSKHKKECACGCAGIFSHHAAVELYTQVFEEEGKLENLEAFLSKNGADFYKLPYNAETITLIKHEQKIPETFGSGENTIVPFLAGETLSWSIQ